MEKQIKLAKDSMSKLEALSQEYREECSDLSNKSFRDKVLFLYMSRMEDSQLKVAIYESLKASGYFVVD